MRDGLEAVMAGADRATGHPASGATRRAGAWPAAFRVGTLGALALLAAGCAAFDRGTSRLASVLSDSGGAIGAPWGTARPGLPEQATTVERVALGVPPSSTLQSEGGDVWPGPLPPRATLANPDAALSGIPAYEPATGRREPSAEMTRPPPPGPPRGIGRGAALPPMVPVPREPDQRLAQPPPTPPERRAVPFRADGQVIHTPSGPVVTSGGTDRIQSFNVPGGGTGTAIRDGNTTTLIGPDGRVQTVPTR